MTKMPSVGKKHKDPKKHPQWIETIKNIPSESKASNISHQSSIQIHDLDSSIPARATLSKPMVTTLSIPAFWKNSHEPSREWRSCLGKISKGVTNEDVAMCYDMSLKEFEHSVVHDLFKVCN